MSLRRRLRDGKALIGDAPGLATGTVNVLGRRQVTGLLPSAAPVGAIR